MTWTLSTNKFDTYKAKPSLSCVPFITKWVWVAVAAKQQSCSWLHPPSLPVGFHGVPRLGRTCVLCVLDLVGVSSYQDNNENNMSMRSVQDTSWADTEPPQLVLFQHEVVLLKSPFTDFPKGEQRHPAQGSVSVISCSHQTKRYLICFCWSRNSQPKEQNPALFMVSQEFSAYSQYTPYTLLHARLKNTTVHTRVHGLITLILHQQQKVQMQSGQQNWTFLTAG